MGRQPAHRLALFSVKTGKTPSFLYLFGPITLRGWITGFENQFRSSDPSRTCDRRPPRNRFTVRIAVVVPCADPPRGVRQDRGILASLLQ